MRIVYFICFCSVGYWVYYSVKHEGIFWLVRTLILLASLTIAIGIPFAVNSKFSINVFHSFLGIIVYGIFLCLLYFLNKRTWRICTNRIEKSYGKNPYNNPYLAIKLKEEYFKELEESCTEEELQKGKEIAESAVTKLREKVEKNGGFTENDVDDILKQLLDECKE